MTNVVFVGEFLCWWWVCKQNLVIIDELIKIQVKGTKIAVISVRIQST